MNQNDIASLRSKLSPKDNDDLTDVLAEIDYNKQQDKGSPNGLARQYARCDNDVFYAIVRFERNPKSFTQKQMIELAIETSENFGYGCESEKVIEQFSNYRTNFS